MRPTRIQTFMELAHVWSKRSTCHRLNVGAIIVIDGVALSHGYNGTPSGAPHCSGNDCPGKMICKETIHAEINAIKRMPFLSDGETLLPEVKADMYVTDSPCPDCAREVYRIGIRRVFFAVPYRITDSLDWLIDHGVEVYRVTPAGYVIEWRTKNVVGL